MISWKRILVPTDFSETSTSAVRHGVDLARAYNARLILIYVGDKAAFDVAAAFPLGLDARLVKATRERLLKILTPLEQTQLHPELVIVGGSPAHEIVRAAADREVDLIVMGTHGRDGVSHMLLGSVAEKVIRSASCPVLIIRTPVAIGAQVEYELDAVGAQLSA